jgi:hypothetical protein
MAAGCGCSSRSRRGYRLRTPDSVRATANHLAGQVADLADQGRVGRREVQAEPGVAGQPFRMAAVLCVGRLSSNSDIGVIRLIPTP